MTQPALDESGLADGFTICALFYGDYPDLARSCMESIVRCWLPGAACSLRLGMNGVSGESRRRLCEALRPLPGDAEALAYDSPVNRCKYPMMRHMFHDAAHPIATRWVMWFDDDSRFDGSVSPAAWWRMLADRTDRFDLIGQTWRKRWTGSQIAGIKAQPWYAGKPPGPRAVFATGGWWCLRTAILRRWQYPWRDLTHNGGDTTLGEMIVQQGYRRCDFSSGVTVNGAASKGQAAAPRRGASRLPVWHDYPAPPDAASFDFSLWPVDPRVMVPA